MNLRSVITEKPVRSVTNLSLDVCIYTYSCPSHTVHRCPLILALLVTLAGNVTEVSRSCDEPPIRLWRTQENTHGWGLKCTLLLCFVTNCNDRCSSLQIHSVLFCLSVPQTEIHGSETAELQFWQNGRYHG